MSCLRWPLPSRRLPLPPRDRSRCTRRSRPSRSSAATTRTRTTRRSGSTRPTAPKSIVIGTLKNAGLAVFDLDGETIQRIDCADEDARQNNVDLLYDVRLGGLTRDLAVVTDRGLDHLRVFAIDPAGSAAATPLSEVTVPDPPFVFEGDNDISAYGIAAWKGADGTPYVAISQRHRTALIVVRLVAGPNDSVGFEPVDRLELPSTFALPQQRTWTPCEEGIDELPQVEGMVADARRGILFAAQEDVGSGGSGLARPGSATPNCSTASASSVRPTPDVRPRRATSSSASSTRLAERRQPLSRRRRRRAHDLPLRWREGLPARIEPGQLELPRLRPQLAPPAATSRSATARPTSRRVRRRDGRRRAARPTFAKGLLVTHDGDDEPIDGSTNFKFTRWEDVARRSSSKSTRPAATRATDVEHPCHRCAAGSAGRAAARDASLATAAATRAMPVPSCAAAASKRGSPSQHGARFPAWQQALGRRTYLRLATPVPPPAVRPHRTPPRHPRRFPRDRLLPHLLATAGALIELGTVLSPRGAGLSGCGDQH